MNLKSTIRTILRIRVDRQRLPAGSQPPFGSNIARGNVRMGLKYPISSDQWFWLSSHGWRTIDMRTDRRRYVCVPDKAVKKLLDADERTRDDLHYRLLQWAERHACMENTER